MDSLSRPLRHLSRIVRLSFRSLGPPQSLPVFPVRRFHIAPPRTRNVLARYQRPYKQSLAGTFGGVASVNQADVFETAATAPAGTSFQDIPPPGSDPAVKVVAPVPAMKDGPTDVSETARVGTASSAGRKETILQGVRIPPKPRPPGEEECCMSGCVHCVYTVYATDLEAYSAALGAARDALILAGRPRAEWPDEVRRVAEEGTEGILREGEERVEEGLDPSMAAFLALEGKLKRKQAPETSAAT